MNKRAILISIATCLSLSTAAFGCASADTGESDDDDGPTGSASSALSGVIMAESASRTAQVVDVPTGYGVPGSGSGYPPGVCGFVRLRGGFNGTGDYASIEAGADGQWHLVVSNGFSITNGPAASIRCMFFSELYKNGTQMGGTWSAAYSGTAVAHATFITPVDIQHLPSSAPYFPTTNFNVLSHVGGHLATASNYASFATTSAWPTSAVATRAAFVDEGQCNVDGPECYTYAGGWSINNSIHGINYQMRDVSTFNTAYLSSIYDTFCFITNVNRITNSDSVTISALGAPTNKWSLSVSGNGSAQASCIRFIQ